MELFVIKNLSFSYNGKQDILNLQDLEIKKNRVSVFSGPNGSGKTTLLKILAGFLRPSSKEIRSFVNKERIVYLPQDPYILKTSVKKNIEYGLKIKKEKNISIKVEKALDMAGLSSKKYLDRKWYELSGGEKKRAALAARFALNPEVLILDEPSEGIDYESRILLSESVKKACRSKKMSVIISSHDREWADDTGDDFFSVIKGKVFKGGFLNITDKYLLKNDDKKKSEKINHENFLFALKPEKIQIKKENNKSDTDSEYILPAKVVSSKLICEGRILYSLAYKQKRFFAESEKNCFLPGDNVFILFKETDLIPL
ncbi:MAG: ATP-binding cassette domain-containing protein [Thermodesulfobacteriota bacterium]